MGSCGVNGGVLTADFHAAESRGLRHWFAALREGCGPGPPRHDPKPVDSLSASDSLNGSADRYTESSHPKRDDSKRISLDLREDRQKASTLSHDPAL